MKISVSNGNGSIEIYDEHILIDELGEDRAELFELMGKLYLDTFQTFVEKNMDYNSSFLTAGAVEAELSDSPPFDSPAERNLYKTFTRIQDKHQRFYEQAFGEGENMVDEALIETATDAANYWFMMALIIQYYE